MPPRGSSSTPTHGTSTTSTRPGWTRTYLLVAALLPLHPEVAGLTAYGWTMTLSSSQISPRLNYLRRRPLERGAFVLRGHTSTRHEERDRELTNTEAAIRGRRVQARRTQDRVAQARHLALGRPHPTGRRVVLSHPTGCNAQLMPMAASGSKAPRGTRASSTTTSPINASSLVDQLAVSTPPDVFEAHMRKLARDYEAVSLDAVLSGGLPRRALLITFDDGYRSVAEVALPILRRLGLPSLFFVTGECLERDSLPLDNLLSHLCVSVGLDRVGAALDPDALGAGKFPELLDLVAAMSYDRRLEVGNELAERFDVDQARLRDESGLFLDAEDLAGLAAYGCEVANHARTHLFCRSIVDEASAHDQLVEHAQRLESLTGRRIRAFSYPYGRRRGRDTDG